MTAARSPLRILYASPEMVPFSKTGGLADVAGALPKALADLKQEVCVVVPRHRMTNPDAYGIRSTGLTIRVPIGDRMEQAEILTCTMDGPVRVLLIEKPEFYDRDQLYQTREGDYPDNCGRFTFFSRAVLEACRAVEFSPHVIHCNDWQTGLVPVFLKTLYSDDPMFRDTATVMTVHNLGYQGLFWHLDLPLTHLPWSLFTPEGIEFFGKINFLKAGIVYSDFITTVSRTYSREIQTREQGFGLEGVLRSRKDSLVGILNGIDDRAWNPETDDFLPARYGPDRMQGKPACKTALLKEFGLPSRVGDPVIGMISRLTDQKGLDLVEGAMDPLLGLGVRLVILGTGDKTYENLLQKAAKTHPDKLGVRIGFDNRLAHWIEAGSDMFLMPSRYEPCGLNQMYSLKYGTVPVVRGTGGLNDTISEFNSTKGTGNGFKFASYSSAQLLAAVKRGLKIYRDRDSWDRLVRNGMGQDFSWDRSAGEYLKIYREARLRKKGGKNSPRVREKGVLSLSKGDKAS